MKIKATLIKKYEAQSGETIKGPWRSIDVVLKAMETVDGYEVSDYIPVRFRGEKVDDVVAISEGAPVEARFKIDADERHSQKTGKMYLTVKDFVFQGFDIKKV